MLRKYIKHFNSIILLTAVFAAISGPAPARAAADPLGASGDRLFPWWDYAQSVQVPILLYHSLTEGEAEPFSITTGVFEAHLAAIRDAGYTSVSLDELRAYVNDGAPLPDKPVIITFDDGYLSNYELAFPLLQKYNMKATMFVIGRSMGRYTYSDGMSMTPHFSLAQAREMERSGLVSICSHTYNCHQVEGRDRDPVRCGLEMLDGESREDYIAHVTTDCKRMRRLIGDGADIVAYPKGAHDTLSEVVLSRLGVDITLAVNEGISTVIMGVPQSLRQLSRLSAEDFTEPQELLRAMDGPAGSRERA